MADQINKAGLPDGVFDSYAVLTEIQRMRGKAFCINPMAVTVVLDAVVSLVRATQAAAPAVPAVDALTRYTIERDYIGDGEYSLALLESKDGDYVKLADVQALLATLSTVPDEQQKQPQPSCNAALRAAPAGQHEADSGSERKKWLPTAENINALPEGVREFVHLLEARCDPAGDVAQNIFLRDQCEGLQAMYRKATAAAPQWLDSPQSALGGRTAREGYAANPQYAHLYPSSTAGAAKRGITNDSASSDLAHPADAGAADASFAVQLGARSIANFNRSADAGAVAVEQADLSKLERHDHRGCLMVPDSTGDYFLVSDVRDFFAAEGEATSERKPLTPDEAEAIFQRHCASGINPRDRMEITRAIEQHHGIPGSSK